MGGQAAVGCPVARDTNRGPRVFGVVSSVGKGSLGAPPPPPASKGKVLRKGTPVVGDRFFDSSNDEEYVVSALMPGGEEAEAVLAGTSKPHRFKGKRVWDFGYVTDHRRAPAAVPAAAAAAASGRKVSCCSKCGRPKKGHVCSHASASAAAGACLYQVTSK